MDCQQQDGVCKRSSLNSWTFFVLRLESYVFGYWKYGKGKIEEGTDHPVTVLLPLGFVLILASIFYVGGSLRLSIFNCFT